LEDEAMPMLKYFPTNEELQPTERCASGIAEIFGFEEIEKGERRYFGEF
jgi:hypothetical protein